MSQIIVFFDGHCGLCNTSVDFLIRRDKQMLFRYTPLQGEEAKKHDFPRDDDTLYVWTGNQMLSKSQAWLWLLLQLGGFWKILSQIIKLLPKAILDFQYDLVAKYRYRIFGRRDECRIPSDKERELFLD